MPVFIMKSDEEQLWNAIRSKGANVLVNAGPIGESLGIHLKRIKYLCDKWMEQGRWTLYGSTAGVIEDQDPILQTRKKRGKCPYCRGSHVAMALPDGTLIPFGKSVLAKLNPQCIKCPRCSSG